MSHLKENMLTIFRPSCLYSLHQTWLLVLFVEQQDKNYIVRYYQICLFFYLQHKFCDYSLTIFIMCLIELDNISYTALSNLFNIHIVTFNITFLAYFLLYDDEVSEFSNGITIEYFSLKYNSCFSCGWLRFLIKYCL